MQQITLDKRSGVSRLQAEAAYYVKAFSDRDRRLKHWLGISRYQRELRNLKRFRDFGLRTPDLVAYEKRSRFAPQKQSLLVTREVHDARDLEEILGSGSLYEGGIDKARTVLDALAMATRILHQAGFYHRDLKPRNILVCNKESTPELYFFDCPSGFIPPRVLLRSCIMRDLAHLERGLRGQIRAADMLYLYKRYRGCEKLSPQDKALARDVLVYYEKRRTTRGRRRRNQQRRLD